MLTSNLAPITFDFAEIVAELEIPFLKYKPLNPLKTGSHVEHFTLKKENINKQLVFNGTKTHSSVLLRQLPVRPLVIGFYSSQWKEYGLKQLQDLNQLQSEIKALCANLLVVTPDLAERALEEIIWNNSLSLDFYFDEDNIISQKFKVYSETDPAWNKYPGIDINVPLLATFAIDSSSQVIFDHINHNLQALIPSDDLLSALHTSVLLNVVRKSA